MGYSFLIINTLIGAHNIVPNIFRVVAETLKWKLPNAVNVVLKLPDVL